MPRDKQTIEQQLDSMDRKLEETREEMERGRGTTNDAFLLMYPIFVEQQKVMRDILERTQV